MPDPTTSSLSARLVMSALMLCAVAMPACAPAPGSGAFSGALGNKLRADRPAEVDLATIGSFSWDELFALAPYSMRDENCRLMQLDFLECRTTVPEAVAEGEYFFVFRAKGKIVRAERHLRTQADFAGPGAPLPFPILRKAARFKVVSLAQVGPQGAQGFRLEYLPPGH